MSDPNDRVNGLSTYSVLKVVVIPVIAPGASGVTVSPVLTSSINSPFELKVLKVRLSDWT